MVGHAIFSVESHFFVSKESDKNRWMRKYHAIIPTRIGCEGRMKDDFCYLPFW